MSAQVVHREAINSSISQKSWQVEDYGQQSQDPSLHHPDFCSVLYPRISGWLTGVSGVSHELEVRNLIARGVSISAAVACGITSKGPWRSSKTPGINQALSDAYPKSEGLFALRDGWIKLGYPE